MNKYLVYMHICPNNKKYIGITCKNENKRWNNGNGYKNQYFYRAINKYGWNNIQHVIIARGLTEEESKWLEIELIKVNNTTNPEFGYNITLGGEGCSGYKHTQEWKDNHSKAMSGENNPNYGIIASEERKEKQRKAMIGENNPMYGIKGENHPSYNTKRTKKEKKYLSELNSGSGNPFYGKTHTAESKKKMSDAKKGKNNPNYGNHTTYNSRKIKCVELNETFDSTRQAVKIMYEKYGLKLNYTSINQRINGTSKKDWYGQLNINNKLIKLHWIREN